MINAYTYTRKMDIQDTHFFFMNKEFIKKRETEMQEDENFSITEN